MAYKVDVSAAASEDAAEYASYIASKDGNLAADRWLTSLENMVLSLDEMPNRYEFIPEVESLGKAYRHFWHHSHRVVYIVDEQSKTVSVLRVYHGMRRSLRKDDL